MRKKKPQIFLCHNSKDKPEVDAIYALLKKRGIEPFMDKYNFESFKPWEDELNSKISNIKSAAIFIGKSGLGPWQTKEINKFGERLTNSFNCNIGLVILPGCSGELESYVRKEWPFLAERHWINFSEAETDPLSRLIEVASNDKKLKLKTQSDELENKKENRELRKKLFEIVASNFDAELKKLYHQIELDQDEILKIDKQMADMACAIAIEKNLDLSIQEAAKIFKDNIKFLTEKACKHALTSNLEFQHEPQSIQIKQRINLFNTEIEKYLLRVHNSLITSSYEKLNKLMTHNSGLDYKTYVAALDWVKGSLYKFKIEDTPRETIIKRIDDLIEIVQLR